MSLERFDEKVVQELERELRQALAIEPSADFERRVRARIENAPRRFEWRYALAAAAVFVIVAAVAWQIRMKPGTQNVEAPTAARAGADIFLPDESVIAMLPRETSVKPPAPRLSPLRATEPEIIFPVDQERALARLLELARSGAVSEESLIRVGNTANAATIDIAPLAVQPIPVPEIEMLSGPRGGADRE